MHASVACGLWNQPSTAARPHSERVVHQVGAVACPIPRSSSGSSTPRGHIWVQCGIASFAGTVALRSPRASKASTLIRSEPTGADATGKAAGTSKKRKPKPLAPGSTYPAKDLCSLCGLCDTSHIGRVREACAFLDEGMGRIDRFEEQVHGRRRDLHNEDELYFGVGAASGMKLVKVPDIERPAKRAWTGVVTRIAVEMLRQQKVDAVICVASASKDKPMEPRPILARTVDEVLACGGVKPTLSPNLKPLEELQEGRHADVKRLLFIGVGCQVQALRAIESDLKLEKLYVLGTNCADNPRDGEALQRFLRSASGTPETAIGFEFMQDNRVHVKHSDGRYETIPVFALKEPHTCTGVIAKSCYSCFDYVNALTDLTIGYMAAPWEDIAMTEHSQYCVVRNDRGREMIQILQDAGAVEMSEKAPAAGGLPREVFVDGVLQPELQLAFGQRKPRDGDGPPRWLTELLADAITSLGPQGLDFAKASIDRATLRNIVCARAQKDDRGRGRADPEVLPSYAAKLEERYADVIQRYVEKFKGGTVV